VAILLGVLIGALELFPFVDYFLKAHTRLEIQSETDALYGFVGIARVNPILVGLAVIGLLESIKRKSAWRHYTLYFALLALIQYLILFRVPVFDWFHHLPILNLIYIDRNLQPLAVFAMSVAGGLGFQIWLQPRRRKMPLPHLAALAIALTVFGFQPLLTSPPTLNGVGAILNVVLAIVFIGLYDKQKKKYAPILFIVIALAVNATIHFRVQRPLRYDPYTPPPFVNYLRDEATNTFRTLGLDNYLLPNTSSPLNIRDIRFLEALFPVSYIEYTHRLVYTPEKAVRFTGIEDMAYSSAFDLLGVTHIITRQSRPADTLPAHWESVYQDADVIIYSNPRAMPRAYLLHNILMVSDEKSALDAIENDVVNLRTTGVLVNTAMPELNRDIPITPVAVQSSTANEVTLSVTTEEAAMLVLSEQCDDGWQVLVNAHPEEIHCINTIHRGVYLDAGEHEIVFQYRPIAFQYGLITSIVALIITVLFSGLYRFLPTPIVPTRNENE
jgi:hypothetical protein